MGRVASDRYGHVLARTTGTDYNVPIAMDSTTLHSVRRRRWPGLAPFVILAAAVPIALLALTAVPAARTELRRAARQRLAATTAGVADLADARSDALADVVTSYAARQTVEVAFADGTPAKFDHKTISANLAEAAGLRPSILGAVATDPHGLVAEVAIRGPGTLVKELGSRPWFQHLDPTGRAQVTGADRGAVEGGPIGITAAAVVRSPPSSKTPNQVVGVFAVTDRLRDLTNAVERARAEQGVTVVVVDADGNQLAGPTTGRTDGLLIARRTTGRGWTVAAALPRAAVDALLAPARRRAEREGAAAGALLLVGVVLAVLGRRRLLRAEWQVQRREADAGAVIDGLQRDITVERGRVVEREAARDVALSEVGLQSDLLAALTGEVRDALDGVADVTSRLLQTPLEVVQREYAQLAHGAACALRTAVDDVVATEFDPGVLVEDVIDMVAPIAVTAGIDLVADIGREVPSRVRADRGDLRRALTALTADAARGGGPRDVVVALAGTIGDAGQGELCFTVEGEQLRVAVTTVQAHEVEQFGEQRVMVIDARPSSCAVLLRTLRDWSLTASAVVSSADARAPLLAAAENGEPFDIVLVIGDGPHVDGGGSPVIRLTRPVRRQALVTALRSAFAAPAPVVSSAGAPSESRRVLVVDDNLVNQKVIGRMLVQLGYRPDIVASGPAAVSAVAALAESDRSGAYAAVLLDCRLPGMDGFEAARRIRQQEAGRRTPIIAMTGLTGAGDEARLLDAGMDDTIGRPVRTEQLRFVMARWAATDHEEPA